MKRIYTLLLILLAFSGGLMAQTKTWVGSATGGSWATGSNWSPSGAPGSGNTVIFNSGVTGQITSVPNITLAALRVENNSTVTLVALSGGDRTLTVSAAGGQTTLVIEAGSTLRLQSGANDMDFTSSRSGGTGTTVGQIDGTLVVENGNIATFNTNTVTTIGTGGLIDNDGGTVNSGASSRLLFSSGATYIHGVNGGNIPSGTWNANATVEITGVTNTRPGTLNQTFGNVVWNSPTQTGQLSLAGELADISGNLTVISTGTGNFSFKNAGGATTTTTIAGDFIMSGGTVYFARNSETHNVLLNGNMIMSGGTLVKGNGSGGIVFDRNGLQSFTKSGGTISGAVGFRIAVDAEVDFGTSVLDGTAATFTLDAGGKIISSNANGLSSGTTASGSIQVGGTRSYSNDAIYEFRGAATGTFTTTGNGVRTLIINNTSGEVLLQRAFAVSTALTLTNGYASSTTTNLITVGTAGTSSSANGAFVNGPLAKVSGSNNTFTYYVGKVGAGLHPAATVSSGGGGGATGTFEVEYIRGDAKALGTGFTGGLARVSSCEYWSVRRTATAGGGRTARVRVSWNPSSNCAVTSYVTDLITLRVGRLNGSNWNNEGAATGADLSSSLTDGTATATNSTVSSATVTYYALGTSDASENPLPVLFADVKAYGKNNGVQVEWSNLTERDIIHYQVERSTNGVDFSTVDQQLPKSNRDDKASYTFFDATPANGANYYRIRVSEIDGKTIYSKILRVEIGTTKAAGFAVYPNPVTGKQFTVSLAGLRQGTYTLQVLNSAGQRIYSANINNVGSGVTQMVELPGSVQTGVYMAVVTGDNYRESKQIIVK